jgi:hypothetical protein
MPLIAPEAAARRSLLFRENMPMAGIFATVNPVALAILSQKSESPENGADFCDS